MLSSSNCVCSRSLRSSAPERFVEQQQLRPLDQRARQRHALALPAGQLVRLALRILAELDDVEDLRDAPLDLRAREPFLLQAERHIAGHGHVREQRVGLEHHVDGPLVRRNTRHVLSVDVHRARSRLLKARQHAQQRGLPASGTAEQAENLALEDLKRDIVDGDEGAEALGDVVDADIGLGVRIKPGLGRLTAFFSHYCWGSSPSVAIDEPGSVVV